MFLLRVMERFLQGRRYWHVIVTLLLLNFLCGLYIVSNNGHGALDDHRVLELPPRNYNYSVKYTTGDGRTTTRLAVEQSPSVQLNGRSETTNTDGTASKNATIATKHTSNVGTVGENTFPANTVQSTSGYLLAQRVQRNCKHVNQDFEKGQTFWITRMHLLSKHKSLFCPIEKVGSTFWRRFIYQVYHTEEKRNPFEVSISEGLSQHFESLPNTTTPNDVGDHFKFTFVRDPYNRILSAYIDKVFAPNPMFWHRFGEQSVTRYRDPARVSASKQRCFSDATFTEFVQFVTWSVTKRQRLDTHTLIESEMCIMCSLNYTFIGKMENFKSDSADIYRHFGLDEVIQNSHISLSKQATMDAIEDSIGSPFSWRKDITQCMGWLEALLRIWRKLQLRGFIELKHKLTFNRKTAQDITKGYFLQLAYIAHTSSNRTVLKEQKRQVVTEMFREVPENVLNEFRAAYEVDFKLLDYDDKPGYIFDRSQNFVYKNVMDIRN